MTATQRVQVSANINSLNLTQIKVNSLSNGQPSLGNGMSSIVNGKIHMKVLMFLLNI